MAAEHSTIIKPDLKEIIASAAAWVVALAVSLSNDLLRADQAMAIAAAGPTLAWTAMNTHTFRHWFTPKPSQASDAEEDLEDDEHSRWGIHRRWLLGIVTPVVVVILLSIGYQVDELVGPDARIPGPLVLLLVLTAAPWVVGLMAWLVLVVPAGLIYSGLRRDMGARRTRVFGGIWAYVFVAFAVTAAQGAAPPTFGRPGWMGEGIATLFGFNEEAVSSPRLAVGSTSPVGGGVRRDAVARHPADEAIKAGPRRTR